jgi:hypothetical protein
MGLTALELIVTGTEAREMQFFIELLIWHVIIAAFLVGALMLSRHARQQNSTMTFADDTQNH